MCMHSYIAISQNHPFSSKYKSKAVVVQKVVDDKAAARIEYIKELKLLGFTADEIKEELKKL
jgi:hypothetical protein